MAFGNVNGGVRVISKNAAGEFMELIDKDNILDGPIKEMCFTNENPSKLIVVGGNKRKIMCVKVEKGAAFIGDIMPPDATGLCCDMKGKKPF